MLFRHILWRCERPWARVSQWRLSLRTVALGGLAAILVWLVISRSLAAYLAEVSPQTALWLNPRQPEALVNLADQSLNAAQNVSRPSGADQAPQGSQPNAAEAENGFAAGVANQAPALAHGAGPASAASEANGGTATDARGIDVAKTRAWIDFAVKEEPLNARALRILGQLASTSNDHADTAKFMELAAKLSLHESGAVFWLMRESALAGDYKEAVTYADALLRTNPGLHQFVVPALAQFAEDDKSSALVKAALAGNPPWRDLFFAQVTGYIKDAHTPLELLLALKTSPNPPSAHEIGGYISFLIQYNVFELAYYAWLQFLPPEQLDQAGLLFNGNFDFPPSGTPFDWMITQGSGVNIDVVPNPDDPSEHALSIDFLYGRVDYQSVTELVVLAPGAYQFDGRYKGKLAGPRGLKWRITCASEPRTLLGESAMINGLAPTWKNVEFAFTVPADCRAQYVRLDLDARTASERLVSGSVLFDELHISRLSNPPGVAASVSTGSAAPTRHQ